jgi:hypothetical protein
VDGLTPEELAYMRQTQAEHRPTEATLSRRTSVRTPSGGSTDSWVPDEAPIDVRIDSAPDEIPEALAARYGIAGLAKATLDLVHDVRSGDRLTVSPEQVYEIVTDGEVDAWTTAQVVWMNRLTRPARA